MPVTRMSGGRLAARCEEERQHEQRAEQQVDTTECERGGLQALLHEQRNRRDTVSELLQHRNEHQWPIARRAAGNRQKYQLPGESDSDEAVKEFRMRDGRRIVLRDLSCGEI